MRRRACGLRSGAAMTPGTSSGSSAVPGAAVPVRARGPRQPVRVPPGPARPRSAHRRLRRDARTRQRAGKSAARAAPRRGRRARGWKRSGAAPRSVTATSSLSIVFHARRWQGEPKAASVRSVQTVVGSVIGPAPARHRSALATARRRCPRSAGPARGPGSAGGVPTTCHCRRSSACPRACRPRVGSPSVKNRSLFSRRDAMRMKIRNAVSLKPKPRRRSAWRPT